MKIGEVMSRGARTCRTDDSLAEAARIMWEGDCGCLPVVDAAGRLAGMITDRDVCMAAYTQGARLQDCRVASAMTRDAAACTPADSLGRVHELMRSRRVRRIPVLDAERKPIGVVTLGDLVRGAQHALSDKRETHEVLRTLDEVARPRVVAPSEPGTLVPLARPSPETSASRVRNAPRA